MNCTAIYAEVRENNRRVRELGREQGWKAVRRRGSTPALWLLHWRAAVREQGSGCRGLELSRLL